MLLKAKLYVEKRSKIRTDTLTFTGEGKGLRKGASCVKERGLLEYRWR